MADSTTTARTIISHLIANGVRTFVLCPGSRSAPFAYALYDAEQAGLIRLHVETDERVGGFVALGAGSVGELTAVVTTSGSAVANLHPAVEEAYYGGIPLIVLSSDRPHHMRGVRASQTTDHRAVLAGSMRDFREFPAGGLLANAGGLVRRIVGSAQGRFRGTVPGPVHINVGFVEPLMPDSSWDTAASDVAQAQRESAKERADVRAVVVAGSSRYLRNLDFALFDAVPILAEPTSGLRQHPNAVVAHPIMLSTQLRGQINRVLVVGHPTLTREVSALLADEHVDVFIVDDLPAYADVAGQGRVVDAADIPAVLGENHNWLAAWQAGSAAAENYIRQHVTDFSYAGIGREISRLSTHLPLIVGASSIIREINLYAALPAPPVYANRALAGIDGTMSSALGIGLATGKPVRVVLGDLTFVHDLGALVHTAHQRSLDLDVVVIDDGGGSIFATLEYGTGHQAVYDRVFRTAKELDIEAFAQAVGASYQPVDSLAQLRQALGQLPVGVRIVHVRLGYTAMDEDRALRSQLRQHVLHAVHLGLNDIQ